MDTLDNMRTFLVVVRTGSFSAAARELDTVPSVIAKRVNQLEHSMKMPLFRRSTRSLELTPVGHRCHTRFMQIVTEVDHAFKDAASNASRLEERLRIKCPTTLTILHFGALLTRFQAENPGIQMELVLMDRSVNPVEEGFDLAIGALPSSYANVVDIPLCPMPRAAYAAPSYIERHGEPVHPRDLIDHKCLSFLATGSNWQFEGSAGAVSVNVPTSFSVNDSHVLLNAVEQGLGIAMIASHIARRSVAAGRIVQVLTDYPVQDLWVKALVPANRHKNPAVQAVVACLRDASAPVAPWDREIAIPGTVSPEDRPLP